MGQSVVSENLGINYWSCGFPDSQLGKSLGMSLLKVKRMTSLLFAASTTCVSDGIESGTYPKLHNLTTK